METVAAIAADRVTLQEACAKKGVNPGNVSVREVDTREDAACVALAKIMEGWAELAAYIPQGKAAQEVKDRVFKDGVKFVNYTVKKEWAEGETKLHTIENEGLTKNIEACGALPVLAFLKETHALYGNVIGTTQVNEEPPEIAESKAVLLDSMRTYIVRVAGIVDRKKPASQARADALVKPITEWKGKKPAKSASPGAEPKPGNTQAPSTEANAPAQPPPAAPPQAKPETA